MLSVLSSVYLGVELLAPRVVLGVTQFNSLTVFYTGAPSCLPPAVYESSNFCLSVSALVSVYPFDDSHPRSVSASVHF